MGQEGVSRLWKMMMMMTDVDEGEAEGEGDTNNKHGEKEDDNNKKPTTTTLALAYWLMKSEPESRIEKGGVDVKFSIEDLENNADGTVVWDGIVLFMFFPFFTYYSILFCVFDGFSEVVKEEDFFFYVITYLTEADGLK